MCEVTAGNRNYFNFLQSQVPLNINGTMWEDVKNNHIRSQKLVPLDEKLRRYDYPGMDM